MATVIFYNFILLSSTFFLWVSEKGKGNLERYIFLGIAFLLVFVPAAIRYDIGTDYLNYLAIYNDSWRIPLEEFKLKEPAFYFTNWFLSSIGAHSQWAFATFAFLFTATVFKAYPKKNAWLLHFLIITSLWFFSFNGIRQAIAISFCLLALFYYFDKRYLWFLTFTLIASMFHQSAMFVIAAGALASIPLNKRVKSRVAPLIFVGLIAFTFLSMHVVLTYMEGILNLFGLTKYSAYFSSTKHFATRDFGSGLGVLVKVFFAIYLIFNTKSLIRLNKQYWFLIILVFIYAIAVVLAANIIIFGRMADIFVIAPILGAYLLFHIPSNAKVHRVILFLFLLFQIMAFIKGSFGIPSSYGDPKLNPYQIFIGKLNE